MHELTVEGSEGGGRREGREGRGGEGRERRRGRKRKRKRARGMSFESLCLPTVGHAASQAGDCSECCCKVVSGRQAGTLSFHCIQGEEW